MPPHRRFEAPAGNGEVLAVPGFDAVPRLVEENRRRLDRADVVVGGLPLRELRALACREALDAAREYLSAPGENPPAVAGGFSVEGPLLLAGHQPELSHSGVWVKNFALNGLARRLGGVPLHLIVDNDTLKNPSLRFPVFRDRDPRSVHLESVAFDKLGREVAYEGRSVLDPELFRTFADRTAPLWRNWGYEPLLQQAWPRLVPPYKHGIGRTFASLRRRYEREWGCDNLELPVSRLSHTTAFARFVWQIFTDLPRFREVYNDAAASYRRAHGIKNASHPVPDLARDGIWIEAPFWSYQGGTARHGRRARFFVGVTEPELSYRYVDGPSYLTGPIGTPRDLVEFVRHVPRYHNFRPRALTLTLFARACLGDFFIHGIGGGKYDEVTDAIIRDYFGVEPPAYQVLSATLHLPLPGFPSTADDVERAERLVRDLTWNPQRHLPPDVAARPDVAALVGEKVALAAAEPPYPDHAARGEWFRELHRLTERLRPLVADQVAAAEAALTRARTEARANAVLRRRDYAWVLYPEDTLRPFLQQFLDV